MPNNTECDNARPRDSICRLKDSPSLLLVVYPSPRKSWNTVTRIEQGEGSHPCEYGSRAPALGPKAARVKRDTLSTDRNSGRDPIIARKLARERQHEELDHARAERERGQAEKAMAQLKQDRGAITTKSIAQEWLKHYRPHWSKGHAAQCEQSLQDYVYPVIGAKHPESVEPAHVLDLIGGMLADGKVETARHDGPATGQ